MKAIMVKVPTKLVNILSDTRNPRVLLGGKAENMSTINPAMTTSALKSIAVPECLIAMIIAFCGSFVSWAYILYISR